MDVGVRIKSHLYKTRIGPESSSEQEGPLQVLDNISGYTYTVSSGQQRSSASYSSVFLQMAFVCNRGFFTHEVSE